MTVLFERVMQNISFKRLLVAALFAALFGSTIGTVLLFGDEIAGHPLRRLMGYRFLTNGGSLNSYLLIYPGIWVISLFGTLFGSLLIGAPAIYPFRNLVARHPLLSAIPTIICAVLLATLLLGWTITPTAYGVKFYETIWFYSAGSELGFVIALGLGWPQITSISSSSP
jgi:hypothetical protein